MLASAITGSSLARWVNISENDRRRTVSEAAKRGVPAYQLGFSLWPKSAAPALQEKNGVVYTKPWVVDLILDLSGYLPADNLVDALAIEPAAGDGAFLVPMVHRLVESCKQQERPLTDIACSLLAYELSEDSTNASRIAVMLALDEMGVSKALASDLAGGWIRTGDYLFDAPTLQAADFVLGNPPYIRLEDIDDAVASTYRSFYRTMRGRADIYVAFFEAALRQLKPNGVCGFICADRWMFNQYGSALRELVTAGFGVEAVVEMHNADAFASEVSAYPAITIIRQSDQHSVVVARANADARSSGARSLAMHMHQLREGTETTAPIGLQAVHVADWFTGNDPWPVGSPKRLTLLKRLEDEYSPLENPETRTKVGIGVATGNDEVFITTDPHLVEDSRLLPLAMAFDLAEGKFAWSGHYLVNPWDDRGLVNLDEYPRLTAYYERHKDGLQNRHVARKNPRHWYRTIDRVNPDLTRKRKLYIPDIKNRLHPVLDNGLSYPHHNLYFVQSETWNPEVLGGLLLSSVAQFFVECYAVRMRGGYLRFQAQYLRRIRVPDPQDISAEDGRALVDAFRRRDVALATQVAMKLYRIDYLPPEDTVNGRR